MTAADTNAPTGPEPSMSWHRDKIDYALATECWIAVRSGGELVPEAKTLLTDICEGENRHRVTSMLQAATLQLHAMLSPILSPSMYSDQFPWQRAAGGGTRFLEEAPEHTVWLSAHMASHSVEIRLLRSMCESWLVEVVLHNWLRALLPVQAKILEDTAANTHNGITAICNRLCPSSNSCKTRRGMSPF